MEELKGSYLVVFFIVTRPYKKVEIRQCHGVVQATVICNEVGIIRLCI